MNTLDVRSKVEAATAIGLCGSFADSYDMYPPPHKVDAATAIGLCGSFADSIDPASSLRLVRKERPCLCILFVYI
jgi:hypothetical protein